MQIRRRCICPVCETERPATVDQNGRLVIDHHRPPLKKGEVGWIMFPNGECKGGGIEVAEDELGTLLYAIIHEIFGKLFRTTHFPFA